MGPFQLQAYVDSHAWIVLEMGSRQISCCLDKRPAACTVVSASSIAEEEATSSASSSTVCSCLISSRLARFVGGVASAVGMAFAFLLRRGEGSGGASGHFVAHIPHSGESLELKKVHAGQLHEALEVGLLEPHMLHCRLLLRLTAN